MLESLSLVGLPHEVAAAKPMHCRADSASGWAWPGPLWCPRGAPLRRTDERPRRVAGRNRPEPHRAPAPELGVAILFVTHDLAAARMVGDRIAVMYLGRIVEIGDAEELCAAPIHPYTRALLDTVPEVGRVHVRLSGEPANPLEPPTGCPFHPRAAHWPRMRVPRSRCRSKPSKASARIASPARWHWRLGSRQPGRGVTMAVAEAFVPQVPRRGTARIGGVSRSLRRTTLADKVGLGLLAVLILAGIFAPLLAPYSPITPSGLPFTPPLTGGHLMGTDEVGFDIFSRVLFGLRSSLVGVVLVVTSGVVIGGTIGLVAGTVGGWVDTVLMRITDLFLALPGPVLAIALVAALGPSELHTLVAVAIVWWPFYARIMRGEIRALSARPHLEAAAPGRRGRLPAGLPPPAARGRARHRGHGQPRRGQPGPHPGRPFLPRAGSPSPRSRTRRHGCTRPAVPAAGVVGASHAGTGGVPAHHGLQPVG